MGQFKRDGGKREAWAFLVSARHISSYEGNSTSAIIPDQAVSTCIVGLFA
jgi:hypothetical protein